jgi:hypothetical protein
LLEKSRLMVAVEVLRHLQALERNRRAETAVLSAVHDAEPALGDDALDVIRPRDDAPHDAEAVLCRRDTAGRAHPLAIPSWRLSAE